MTKYSAAITAWKALWTYLQTVGVVGATDVALVGIPESWEEFAAHWPALAIALAPALWRVSENIRKTWRDDGTPLWSWPWDRLVKPTPLIMLLGCCLAFSGCAGFGGTGLFRPAVGDHSQSKVKFLEDTAAGDHTEIEFTATGEAAAKAGVAYTGATENTEQSPWSLSVQGDTSVTSPQATIVAQGYAALLEKTPETIAALADQIIAVMGLPDAATPGGLNIKELLIRFILDRAAGMIPNIGGLLGTLSP